MATIVISYVGVGKHKRTGDINGFKELLRRNFDVIFVKRIIYISSSRKTVSQYLIEMKIFTPQTGKN